MNDSTREIRKTYLLEEYKQLCTLRISSSNSSLQIKGWCITVWSVSLGFSLQAKIDPVIAFPAISFIIVVFWWLNGFYGFYARFWNARYREVEKLMDDLARNPLDDLSGNKWTTPKDPFHGTSAMAKILAVLRSLFSVPILVVYVTLLVVTYIVFVHLLQRGA